MDFSLFYFASDAAGTAGERYRLLLEGARFADTHGFEAVWMPERHFNPFGGIFPNPAVVAAGLATATQHVKLRAGSVVMPLHHPLRVAEEWSVVDNLSGGRVGIAFARGWATTDHVLAPRADGDPDFYASLDQVRALWRGEQVMFGATPLGSFPPPVQPELECWITCAQTPERFVEAGERGHNILTSLILLPFEVLEQCLARYREARARCGHDPAAGKVTLMLHSFVGTDEAAVRRAVEAPFRNYLAMSFDAWAGASERLAAMGPSERASVIDYALERYYRTSALFGTVETCLPLVRKAQRAGVTELACLIDFGIAAGDVLANLPLLDALRRAVAAPPAATADPAGNAADRTELLRALLRKRAEETPVPQGAQSHPASLGQQALWLLQQANPESAAYNTAVSLRIIGTADEAALVRACQRLVDRHDILRAHYTAMPEGLAQTVAADCPLTTERIDATGWDDDRQLAELRRAYALPFDLGKSPVRLHLQVRPGRDLLFMLGIHHIARDGVSMLVLIDDLLSLYVAERDGTDAGLPPPASSFADYVVYERALLAAPQGARLRDAWRAALAGAPTVVEVPGDRSRPARLGVDGATVARTLDAAAQGALRALSRQVGATVNSVLFAVYALLLGRHSAADDLLIGMPALGRPREDFARTAGYFVNMVPCRAVIRPEEPFTDFAGRMQHEIARALAGQGLPFPEIVRLIDPPRDGSRLPLVQMMFGYLRIGTDRPLDLMLLPGATATTLEIAGITVTPALIAQEEGQFDLSLEIIERPDSLHVGLKYNSALFSPATATRFLDQYVTLLGDAIAAPQQAVADLDLITLSERAERSAQHRSARRPIPGHRIEAGVRAQIARFPDAIAVRDSKRSLSFAALGDEVERLAATLVATGAAGQVVGIFAEPSVAALVGILAVLTAGGTFMPLDPAYPVDRLAFMVADSDAAILLVDRPLPEAMPEGPGVIALGDAPIAARPARRPAPGPSSPPSAEAPAYLIYTSGSTGRPKGVAVGHRSVVNLITEMQRLMPLAPGKLLYSITALSFDIVMVELLLPLFSGATLEFAGDAARDPERLRDRLHDEHNGVCLMQATPTMWRLIIEAGWRGTPGLIAVSAGEALADPLAIVLRTRCEQLWNCYGPTEATVYATAIQVTHSSLPGSIGWPFANIDAYVVDARRREVADGIAGELLIGGCGVAIGYHARPELDDERFIPDPFATAAGSRAYCTGDLVRRSADGDLVYLGRIDQQVKIGGVRVELGEIEAVLCSHPAVADAAVIAEMEDERVRRLSAYWRRAQPPEGADAVAPAALRRFLADRLPSAMIPSRFIEVAVLPSTPNGKIDRRALSAAGGQEAPVVDAARPPAEGRLAALWRDVLGVDDLTASDNFFDLGGASLDVIRLVSRARASGFAMEMADIFDHPTLEALELLLTGRGQAAEGLEVVDDLHLPADLLERQSRRAVAVASPASPGRCRSRIESIGVYLPSNMWTTQEVLAGCSRPLEIDLEQLTGIHARPRAGPDEYAIDLAAKAAAQCLARSACAPEAIDLLICCNICRYDADRQISFEPGTAARLRERLGLAGARSIDVSNACAGMFTGIKVADLYLRLGLARRVLVVSGEYITHLTETAQREIDSVLDPRLACLTLGDSGAALLLEPSPDGRTGFQELDLFTLSAHSELCLARPSDRPEGGAIMLTDSLALSDHATRAGLGHALSMLDAHGLSGFSFDRFIMHQTSSTTIRNAQRELKRLLGADVCTPANTVDNLAARGNTSSTTHFVALWDEMAKGHIAAGQRLMFNISASGITLGTAFYTMDDLPERMAGMPAKPVEHAPSRPLVAPPVARIAGIAALADDDDALDDTLAALERVARQCLDDAGMAAGEIDLVLFAGVHRTDFVCEPATATRLARLLAIGTEAADGRVLAFDIVNGGRGLLDACEIAAAWIAAGEARSVLVVTAEIDPNDPLAGHPATGICPGAGALILQFPDDSAALAIGDIRFAQATGTADAARSWCTWDTRGAHLVVERDPAWEDQLLETCVTLAAETLAGSGLTLTDIDYLIPPHPSPGFAARLAAAMAIDPAKLVGPSGIGDRLTAALPAGLALARGRGVVRRGSTGLVLAGGAGVLAGCALIRG